MLAGARRAAGGTVIRVVVADDQPVVRSGIRMILEVHDDVDVVGEAADGETALRLVGQLDPDVVLMDIRMPGLDGLAATRRLAAAGARCRVLILTTYDPDQYVFEALSIGASGFLLKSDSPERLVAGIRAVHAGESVFAPSVTRRLVETYVSSPPPRPADQVLPLLTNRETDVLRLIAQGLSNAEIAAQLFIGEGTVKTHVARILAKHGLRDRVQAVVLAYESGLTRPVRSPNGGSAAR
jgi:DNA-binding NarL/FixJ family response regulator